MLSTPIKTKPTDQYQHNTTASLDISNSMSTSKKKIYSIDYKGKLMELMNQNIELQVREKEMIGLMQDIQYKYNRLQSQLRQFLGSYNFTSLTQASIYLVNTKQKAHTNSPIKHNTQSIPYTTTINQQHQLQQLTHQQYRLQLSKNLTKLSQKYETQKQLLQTQNKKLKQLTQQVIKQNKQLKQTNNKLVKSNQRLQVQLKGSIEQYEQIEQVIQHKLKQYIDKVKYYQNMMIKGGSSSSQKINDFSFGKQSQQESFHKQSICRQINLNNKQQAQTQQYQHQKYENNNILQDEMSAQCYRASIQGLLQQNKRLKKSFQALYKLKQGQQLPQQLKKQINIMKSIIQLNQNIQAIDY